MHIHGIDRKRTARIFGKRVPLWVVIPLLVLLIAVSVTYAITVSQRTYSTLFGEVIDVTSELSITQLTMSIASSSQSAVGNTPATAVTMTSTNPAARTAITTAHWIYQIQVGCITGTTPASTTYKVDLYIDETLIGSLYVASDATPTTGETARCRFDIGTDLPDSASYMIVVTRV